MSDKRVLEVVLSVSSDEGVSKEVIQGLQVEGLTDDLGQLEGVIELMLLGLLVEQQGLAGIHE